MTAEPLGVAVRPRDSDAPPHDKLAERSVLGSVLKMPHSIRLVADILEARDFYVPQHRAIWQAMIDLEAEDKPQDYTTICDKLNQNGTYSASGGLEYLSDISLSIPTAAHIVHYAQIVVRQATLRRLISMAQGLAEAAYRDDKTPEAIMVEMERRLALLSRRGVSGKGVLDSAAAADRYRQRLAQAVERVANHDWSKPLLGGWTSGLLALDTLLLGLKASELIYFAARTSVGKSIIAQQIALSAARAGCYVYVASLEMGIDKLQQRAITMMTGVPRDALEIGNLTAEEQAIVDKAITELAKLPILWDTESTTTEQIRMQIKRWQEETGQKVGLAVVDYMQLLGDRAGQRSSRNEDLGVASRALKLMAKDLELCVLAPVQVSREVLKRKSKMPDLMDLRESGSLEQDADVVLGFDRDDYHDKKAQDHVATIAVLKQRDSGVGRGRGSEEKLIWLPKYEMYRDYVEEDRLPAMEAAVLNDDLIAQVADELPKDDELPWA